MGIQTFHQSWNAVMPAQGSSIPKDFGVMALRAVCQASVAPGSAGHVAVEFAAVHTARSMGFAFLGGHQPWPECCILRQQQPDAQNPNFARAGFSTSWQCH